MAGEPQPTFFEALMAVHREVETLPKDGWNEQADYSFAKGDTVVRKSRELLAKHGLLWVRTGASVTGPTLDKGDIGRMSYVGNVKITGKLMHASGELEISAEPPIVAMGARPHDKAWAASVTFGTGYLLLGILNQDRADEQDINDRADSLGPLCVGKAAPIAAVNRRRVEAIASHSGADPAGVWVWALGESKIDLSKYAHDIPTAPELTKDDGLVVKAVLKLEAGRKGVDDAGPDGDPT